MQKGSGVTGGLPAWVYGLASARWTLLFFLLTGAAALATAYGLFSATVLMAVPFALLLANLSAAILSQPRFRADMPLLLLHLALLALVTLFSLGRLTYMEGTATLTVGTPFEGALQSLSQGPLHRASWQSLSFVNEGLTEDFYPQGKGKHRATENRLRWRDSAGQWHVAQIGDDRPLLLQGYRIYTTRHRGFSPLFRWQPEKGEPEFGTVQLGELQESDFATANAWTLPGGVPAWVMLDLKAASPALPKKQRLNLGAGELAHGLLLRVGAQRYQLKVGDSVDLPGGRLSYVRLDSWMGYQISYDPTPPWIIGAILIGMASLIWYYWRQLL